MSREQIPEICNFIYETRSSERPTEVIFFGGEPMVNYDFIHDFIEYGKKSFNFDHRYSMTTNGTLLTSDRIDYLIENNVGVGITIDGNQVSHDTNRVMIGNKGSWDVVMNNTCEYVSKSKIPASILYVLNENTIDYFIDSYKFINSLNMFGNINITLLFNYDKPLSDSFYEKLEEGFKYLFVYNDYLLPNIFQRMNAHGCGGNCNSPRTNVTITPQGNLFFCHRQTPKDGIPDGLDFYGDMKSGYVNTDFLLKMLKRSSGISKDIPECEGCSIFEWCKGGCIMASEQYTGDWFKINPTVCRINKLLDKFKTIRG